MRKIQSQRIGRWEGVQAVVLTLNVCESYATPYTHMLVRFGNGRIMWRISFVLAPSALCSDL